VSIITNISFDHTNLLGNTLTAIAKEKAGIIKAGVPVVIGEAEGEVKKVFVGATLVVAQLAVACCNSQSSCHCGLDPQSPTLPLIFSQGIAGQARNDSEIGYWVFNTPEYPNLIDELGGFAQEKNAATVLCALEILKKEFTIPPKAVYQGFRYVIENTGLLGRWQIIQYNPKIVLDTGHNVGGIAYIVRQLQSEKYEKLHIVFGMVNDKDISAVLQLLPKDAVYYFTQANIPRALDAKLLAEQAAKFGLKGEIFHTVGESFLAAKQNATKKDFIFVGGSTFVVADALAAINKQLFHNS
jgi:dihydrofolate synthase/folylpolyglutamate synthase